MRIGTHGVHSEKHSRLRGWKMNISYQNEHVFRFIGVKGPHLLEQSRALVKIQRCTVATSVETKKKRSLPKEMPVLIEIFRRVLDRTNFRQSRIATLPRQMQLFIFDEHSVCTGLFDWLCIHRRPMKSISRTPPAWSSCQSAVIYSRCKTTRGLRCG